IGVPMAFMYLLDHPDHYTSHKFRLFIWWGYVNEVHKVWEENNAKVFTDPKKPEKVMLGNIHGKYIAISPVDDYIHRPKKYENVSLYDWIRRYKKH
ncbi:hypothetical protein POSPLADRAFT_1141523, partial [Postia placenta MAD-698-R-SB12]